MNLKYANKIQARCALNRNGRVLDGKIMIGVRKCTDLVSLGRFIKIMYIQVNYNCPIFVTECSKQC